MNARSNKKLAVFVGLFVLLRKCIKLLVLLRQASKKRQILKNLPMMNVSEVIDYLKQHPTIKSIECFVQGIIRSEEPISSIYNKTQKLVCRIVLGSYVHSNNHQQIVNPLDFKDKIIIVRPKLAPTLKLSDITDHNLYGNIKLAADASVSLAFSQLTSQKVPLQMNWLQKLWAIIAAFLKRGVFFIGRFVKGSRVALIKQQLGIKQNQFVNVAAKCSIGKDTLNLYVTNMVKQSYMFHEKVSKILTGYKLSLILFSILTLIYVALLWKTIRPALMSIRQFLITRFPNLFGNIVQPNQEQLQDNEEGKFNCFICYSKTRSIVFKPCKHYGVCKDCYNSLEALSCPVCKADIQGIIQVKKHK